MRPEPKSLVRFWNIMDHLKLTGFVQYQCQLTTVHITSFVFTLTSPVPMNWHRTYHSFLYWIYSFNAYSCHRSWIRTVSLSHQQLFCPSQRTRFSRRVGEVKLVWTFCLCYRSGNHFFSRSVDWKSDVNIHVLNELTYLAQTRSSTHEILTRQHAQGTLELQQHKLLGHHKGKQRCKGKTGGDQLKESV